MEEDGEGQVEVEREEGKVKKKCTWMTIRMGRDSRTRESRGACDPTSKSVARCALAFMLM